MKTKLSIFLLALATCMQPNFLSAQMLACGSNHTLVVCGNNTINTWGDNEKGQLGIGFLSLTISKIPVGLSSINGVIAVGAGDDFSIALKNDGTVWTWGSNWYGKLGLKNFDSIRLNPTQINSLTGITAIASGGQHSFALKNDGTVWVWGADYNGTDGDLSPTGDIFKFGDTSNFPIKIKSVTETIAIAAGKDFSIGLKKDGTIWTWGKNDVGQMGNGKGKWMDAEYFPLQLTSLSGVIAISAGKELSLALKNDGTVWSWGYDDVGQLGNGTNIGSNVPIQVNSLTGIIAISAGQDHCLALKNDGTVWAWGNNGKGELGNGSNANSNVPVQVSNLTDIISIAAGTEFSVAIRKDGTIWAWGFNGDGELGNGTTTDSNVPVPCYVQH